MLGLYINNKLCLCIILSHPNARKRVVHRAGKPDERGSDTYGLMHLRDDGTCELIFENASSLCGTYLDDMSGVRWEDGEEWRKLEVSASQVAELSYKPPFMPISIVLVAAVLTVVQCIGKGLVRLISTELAPNMRVHYSRKRVA